MSTHKLWSGRLHIQTSWYSAAQVVFISPDKLDRKNKNEPALVPKSSSIQNWVKSYQSWKKKEGGDHPSRHLV